MRGPIAPCGAPTTSRGGNAGAASAAINDLNAGEPIAPDGAPTTSRSRDVGAASAAINDLTAAEPNAPDGAPATRRIGDVGAASPAISDLTAAEPIAPDGAPTTPRIGDVGAASAAISDLTAAEAIGPDGAPTAPRVGDVGAASAAISDSTAAEPNAPGGAPATLRVGDVGAASAANQPFHGRNLRSGRTSIVGQMYLLTTVTQGRRPLFGDPRLARVVVRALRTLSHEGACTTNAFVIMPDHVHWLVTLSAGSLDGLVARAKSRSAREINDLRSTQGTPVWQRGFHDHALRRDEDVREVARYIVGNPVRAGIVGNARDYPWWDAEWL